MKFHITKAIYIDMSLLHTFLSWLIFGFWRCFICKMEHLLFWYVPNEFKEVMKWNESIQTRTDGKREDASIFGNQPDSARSNNKEVQNPESSRTRPAAQRTETAIFRFLYLMGFELYFHYLRLGLREEREGDFREKIASKNLLWLP